MFERFLLDTNMVLNAAFIAESWARKVVALARTHGIPVFVGQQSLGDAHTRAQRIAVEARSRKSAATYIDSMLRVIGAVIVPAAEGAPPAGIPRHDHHVALEAAAARASIVTSDRELWLACRAAGVPALVPMQIFRQFEGMTLGMVAFGVMPTRSTGSLFARGHVGAWADATGTRHTLLDMAGSAWLSYSTTDRAWIAEVTGLEPLVLRSDVVNGRQDAVALSWSVGDSIRLRCSSAEHPVQRFLRDPLPAPMSGQLQTGGHSSGQHYWGGTMWVCVVNDRPISSDLWRDLKQDQELTPNPFDDDRVAAAIRQWCL